MAFFSLVLATLSLINDVSSVPTTIPKCIERTNPMSDPCFDETSVGSRITLLTDRDVSEPNGNLRAVQFADTFTNTNETGASPSAMQFLPDYPRGFALSYPGFADTSIKNNKLLLPSPPDVLITNASIQSITARQPGIIRDVGTSSFDLRSTRFACAYEKADGSIALPPCLVTFVCKPKIGKDAGIPSGHRPTPRSPVKNTFEFVPNVDQSSLPWTNPTGTTPTPQPRLKSTLFANADFGDEFYDLDHCYIMLQQYGSASAIPMDPPSLLIDDVVGVAYIEDSG